MERVHIQDLKGPGEVQAQQYSDMPKGSKRDVLYVDAIQDLAQVQSKIERLELVIKTKTKNMEDMNTQLKLLKGTRHSVYKLKEIDGLNYMQIGQALNMSDRTARRIYDQIKKGE